jgi:glycosyltransferase involved in cell wall biosynthesis
MLKFGVYTTFYNCERFVNKIFTSIESLNYNNFEWHITDDYSSDNTKSLVLERLNKSPLKHKIKYFEQSEKKQMYWKPNEFFDETFYFFGIIRLFQDL